MPCNGSRWNGDVACEGCPRCTGRSNDAKEDKKLQEERAQEGKEKNKKK